MASHFARRTLIQGSPSVQRLSQNLINFSSTLAEKRRVRFLAARSLLADLMLRVYGLSQLPEMTHSPCGRPRFADPDLPDFSLAYAGNIIGVLLAEEGGRAGLGIEIVRAHSRQTQEQYLQGLSSGERAWINAQNDPSEAVIQLWTLRKSLKKLTDRQEGSSESLRLHPASGRLRSLEFPDIQAVSDVEPLMIWSCALSPGSERLHLWESDEAQSWTRLQDIQVNRPALGQRMLRLTSMPTERVFQG
ncbi:4'-phosphopantetheinyl transferase family protein [Erwinia sp.]|uniref:4'-phosphopantetheinyl transferase family protein n=1 Tax=Erwinia citreus TaxID=558 RepID=UPI003C75C29D